MNKKIRIILLILLLLLTIPVLISSYENTPIKLIINDKEYTIYKDTEEINLVEYNTYDSIIITKKTINYRTILEKEKLKYNKPITIPRQKINSDNKLNIEIKYFFHKNKNIKINILPSTFPSINISGSSKYVGDYYLSTIKENTIFNYQIIINEYGEIIYYKQTEHPTYDFQKNNNLYTYIENNNLIIQNNKDIKIIPNAEQYLFIDDDKYIIYSDNNLRYQVNDDIIWKQETSLKNISLDLDNNILLVDKDNNRITKIDLETGSLIWKIDSQKGMFKLSTKQKISSIITIYPINKNQYQILTEKKLINIKLNEKKKKISSFTTEKNNLTNKILVDPETNTFLETNGSIIEEKNSKETYLKIETNIALSTITKK